MFTESKTIDRMQLVEGLTCQQTFPVLLLHCLNSLYKQQVQMKFCLKGICVLIGLIQVKEELKTLEELLKTLCILTSQVTSWMNMDYRTDERVNGRMNTLTMSFCTIPQAYTAYLIKQFCLWGSYWDAEPICQVYILAQLKCLSKHIIYCKIEDLKPDIRNDVRVFSWCEFKFGTVIDMVLFK